MRGSSASRFARSRSTMARSSGSSMSAAVAASRNGMKSAQVDQDLFRPVATEAPAGGNVHAAGSQRLRRCESRSRDRWRTYYQRWTAITAPVYVHWAA
jgi:hypothetical protein